MSFLTDLVEGNFGNLGNDITHAPSSLINHPDQLAETLGGVGLLAGGAFLAPELLAGGAAGAGGDLATGLGIGDIGSAAAADTAATAAAGGDILGSTGGGLSSLLGFSGEVPTGTSLAADFGFPANAITSLPATVTPNLAAAPTSALGFAAPDAASGFGLTDAELLGGTTGAAAPASAAGGATPAGFAATDAELTGGVTGAAAPTSGSILPGSITGWLANQNPLMLASLGLGAGTIAKGLLFPQKVPNQDQLNQLAAQAQQQAGNNSALQAQLVTPLLTGNLPPGQQAVIQKALTDAITSIKARYAQLGMSGSTAETDAIGAAMASAQQQAGVLEQQMAQTGMQAGSLAASDMNVAGSIYSNIMNATMRQDEALQSAIANFAGQAALASAIGGRKAA